MFVKRLMDIFFAIILAAVLIPVFFLLTLLVYCNMGKPVLFKQQRPGKNGKLFTMFKYRTMLNSTNNKGEMLSDDDRLTKLGRFLRSASLDELPELINVIKGDMSFVGPRPLLDEYLELYTPEQKRRHDVKPGITGWAQVNGRNAISWEEKFRFDLWYIDNWTLWFDLKILFLTIFKVFKREGISHSGNATMEKFKGING